MLISNWLALWHLCFPFSGTVAGAAPVESGPRILVEHPVIDAGFQWIDCCGHAEWLVRNTGDAPLMFEVRSSCCVDLDSWNTRFRTIAPGQSDFIRASFQARKLGVTDLSCAIILETNDVKQSKIMLGLVFQSLSPMRFDAGSQVKPGWQGRESQFEVLGISRGSESEERCIDVFAADAGPIDPRLVSVDIWPKDAPVSTSLECVLPGAQYLLRFEYAPPWPMGIRVAATIDSGVPGYDTMLVSASATGILREPKIARIPSPPGK